ncbi:MAG TPA: hypothetical protein VHL53_03835 [Acidimicrobiia bacterium]|nr:hypothetical protein [Acidimicrobiia bacterium]
MSEAQIPTLTAAPAVIDALLTGEQIVDLRVGDGPDGPPTGATRFWLRADPAATAELKPAYRRARELSVPAGEPPAGQVRIAGWAELVGRGRTVIDDKATEALNGKTVLALEPLAGQDVLVLALRVHRLVEPLTGSEDLAGLPADPRTVPSEPALSGAAFEARLRGLENALPASLESPG